MKPSFEVGIGRSSLVTNNQVLRKLAPTNTHTCTLLHSDRMQSCRAYIEYRSGYSALHFLIFMYYDRIFFTTDDRFCSSHDKKMLMPSQTYRALENKHLGQIVKFEFQSTSKNTKQKLFINNIKFINLMVHMQYVLEQTH